MSLDKAIASGKENRKPYRRGKAIDGSCRNHGSCPACHSNRTYREQKEKARIAEDLKHKGMVSYDR